MCNIWRRIKWELSLCHPWIHTQCGMEEAQIESTVYKQYDTIIEKPGFGGKGMWDKLRCIRTTACVTWDTLLEPSLSSLLVSNKIFKLLNNIFYDKWNTKWNQADVKTGTEMFIHKSGIEIGAITGFKQWMRSSQGSSWTKAQTQSQHRYLTFPKCHYSHSCDQGIINRNWHNVP